MITETDDVARALETAAKRWPEDRERPAKLLRRLVQAGSDGIRDESAQATSARLRAIKETDGALTGAYEPDYLQRIREDWPD